MYFLYLYFFFLLLLFEFPLHCTKTLSTNIGKRYFLTIRFGLKTLHWPGRGYAVNKFIVTCRPNICLLITLIKTDVQDYGLCWFECQMHPCFYIIRLVLAKLEGEWTKEKCQDNFEFDFCESVSNAHSRSTREGQEPIWEVLSFSFNRIISWKMK